MRLMFIIPRRSGGGAEKVIAFLASGLAERHEVFLVSMLEPIGYSYPVSEHVTVINLKSKPTGWRIINRIRHLLHLDRFTPPKKIKKALHHSYPASSLKKLKQSLQIDCSISFLSPANYINTAAESSCPAIISIRSCMVGKYAPAEANDPEGRELVLHSCRHADKIVSVSKEAVPGLVNFFEADPDKISVIYNPCDCQQIRKLGTQDPEDKTILRRMEAAEFVFFSNGRITQKNGQWHLLHAFSHVLEKHPKALLIILGKANNDETEKLLKDIINKKGMETHVILAGFHANPFAFLSRGDAFVMSSFNEGFPNALIEAMALGLPVISTDCSSGPREILAPSTICTEKTTIMDPAEYGILVPECSGNQEINRSLEKNEIIMADAMIRLIEDPELRNHYSEQSRKRAEQFDKEDFLRHWETLIQDAVTEKRNRPDIVREKAE